VGTANGSSTLNGWWRADKGVTLSGGAVSNWADQSGYAHDLEQSNTFNQPTSGVSVRLIIKVQLNMMVPLINSLV